MNEKGAWPLAHSVPATLYKASNWKSLSSWYALASASLFLRFFSNFNGKPIGTDWFPVDRVNRGKRLIIKVLLRFVALNLPTEPKRLGNFSGSLRLLGANFFSLEIRRRDGGNGDYWWGTKRIDTWKWFPLKISTCWSCCNFLGTQCTANVVLFSAQLFLFIQTAINCELFWKLRQSGT